MTKRPVEHQFQDNKPGLLSQIGAWFKAQYDSVFGPKPIRITEANVKQNLLNSNSSLVNKTTGDFNQPSLSLEQVEKANQQNRQNRAAMTADGTQEASTALSKGPDLGASLKKLKL